MAIRSIRVELNRKGVIALLQSQDVADEINRRGEAIARAAGEGVEVDSTRNRDRAVTFVRTATEEAREAEAESRALSRAIDAGR
jgi:hypothetical protein